MASKETHSIVFIQQLIGSYERKVRAPVESVDEMKRLPTGKPSQEVTWASIALLSALSARDLHG